MHDLILTSKYKLWLCSYFRVIKEFFLVFLGLPFFQNKQSRDKNDLFIKILETKSPTQVHFRLGRDGRIFLKSRKQTKQALFEQLSSRKNIKSDPSATKQTMCQLWVP